MRIVDNIPPGPVRLILRRYEAMAMQAHYCCWKCNQPIEPGQIYEGEVAVVTFYDGRKVFSVSKLHVFPVCDWPFDDEDSDKTEVQVETLLEAA